MSSYNRHSPTNWQSASFCKSNIYFKADSCVRPSSLDVAFVDYDGVRFHMTTPEKKTVLLLSMHIRCWDELVKYGARDILKREYGSLLAPQSEPEYNVSLLIDLEQVPQAPGKYIFIDPDCSVVLICHRRGA
jgi:hypothetical protein